MRDIAAVPPRSAPSKLYVVVRADLPPGLQMAQAIHAAREYAAWHPVTEERWFRTSNTITVCSVPNEEALTLLLQRAKTSGIGATVFREPDRGHERTAAAFEPGHASKRLCRGLPLALA